MLVLASRWERIDRARMEHGERSEMRQGEMAELRKNNALGHFTNITMYYPSFNFAL